MELDHDACYKAMTAADPRFDGRLFVGVRTTGVYCRPICPARTPKRENVTFFPTAAAAQEAGFRPCLRCRPECSPDLAVWRGTANTVSRALALIEQGALDAGSIADLADRLGVGERHLRRLFSDHLGASPLAVAQTRRVHFAKQLIVDTDLSMTEIALAAGFGSVRRFNAVFQKLYERPPSALRRRKRRHPADAGLSLTLPFAPPYDWQAMIRFLSLRAIPGVEHIDDNEAYHRTILIDGVQGTVSVRPMHDHNKLEAIVRFPHVAHLGGVINRLRRVFDLAADIEAVEKDLSGDDFMARLVAQQTGLRLPGAWDGFELGVRAVLGQQITVAAATKLAGDFVEMAGRPLNDSLAQPGLRRTFPDPEHCLSADLSAMKMPRSRTATLITLAKAVRNDPDIFDLTQPFDVAIERLCGLKGIGPWTAEYIAMRALGAADAFPSADVGILRALTASDGSRPTPEEASQRAEHWRPWRAYAVLHLWQSLESSELERVPRTKAAPTEAVHA